MRRTLRIVLLYPLLVLSSCHLLMTGSPIPLWYFEELQSPTAVRIVTDQHLILDDGRTVKLPFISEIPHSDPLFRAALAEGVEVTEEGEAYGLMWLDRVCGNDPVVWKKMRVNLSDLAGALHPKGLDESIVNSETIAYLSEHHLIDSSGRSSSHSRGRISTWDRMTMRTVREQVEYSVAQLAEANE